MFAARFGEVSSDAITAVGAGAHQKEFCGLGQIRRRYMENARWLARQQQQPIGAPDFADIAGRDLHEAVSASPPLPSA
jgi:hypothetical protein